MDSYFLTETLKYLYLLFDPDNPFNSGDYIFSTEGHMFPLNFQDYAVKNNVALTCSLPQLLPLGLYQLEAEEEAMEEVDEYAKYRALY